MKILSRLKHQSISTKVALSFILVVILQGTLTLVGMSILISESNSLNFEKQMVQRMNSNEAFIQQTLSDLGSKVNLLSGQKNVVAYTQFRLINLLNRELSLFNRALNLGGIFVFSEEGDLLGSDGTQLDYGFQVKSLIGNTYARGESSFITQKGADIHLWNISQIVSGDRVIGILGGRIAMDSHLMDRFEQISGAISALRYENHVIFGTAYDSDKGKASPPIPEELPMSGIEEDGNYLYGVIPLNEYGFLNSSLITILDMNESRRLIRRYNLLSVSFTMLVLVLAAILGILFYRRSFLKPYLALQEAVRRIGSGDFTYPIRHESTDEFGALVDSVEQMRISLMKRDRELKDLATYNELILNNVRSGILTIGEDGKINTWNSAAREMVHLDRNVPVSLPIPLDEAGLPDTILRVIREGLERDTYSSLRECRSVFRGEEEIFLVTISPFSGGMGEKLGMIAVMADITQVKKLEEKLYISQRLAAIGEMVSAVAHQLRNPMAIMKVSAEMLRDNYRNDDQYAQLTTMLVSEIDSLNYVIANFLDFARPIHANPAECDIGEVIRDSLAMIPLSQFSPIGVRLEIDGGMRPVLLDKGLMEQVFCNLILNALEASRETKPTGEVVVKAEMKGESLQVTVRDWGVGMDDDTLQRIFNPFYTTKTIGIGLGLSVVHRILAEHGGRVEVQSAPGEGSTFTVVL